MALLKKCNVCENKGFRLKLNEGLCPNCMGELENLEENFITLISALSLPNSNKEKLLKDIENLVNNLPKFETEENSKKLLNYKNQFEIIRTTINLTINNSDLITNNKIQEPTSNYDKLSANIAIEQKNIVIPTIQSKESPIKSNNDNFIEKNQQNTSYNSTDTPFNTNSINKSNDSINETSNNLNTITNATLSTEENNLTPLSEPKQDIKNKERKSPENDLITQQTINDLYIEVSNIIGILSNNSISDNIMAENLFSLKENYLPLLKKCKIGIIMDFNIDQFISEKLKILSLRTNQKIEDLYSFFNYVTVAIETTGIKPDLSDIIEISALKIRYGKIVDEFYTLINPNKSIKLIIEERTGISTDDVKDAPPVYIGLCKFVDFTEGLKIVSHNESFTSSFLNLNYDKIKGTSIPNETTCTMKLYRIRYKNYFGIPTENFDIFSCANDLLNSEDVSTINSLKSLSSASSLATYKIYEILKYKYK